MWQPSTRTLEARRQLERLRIRFAVLGDRDGTIARRFGVKAYPETLVLAADGKVAARFRGPVSVETLEEAVARAG